MSLIEVLIPKNFATLMEYIRKLTQEEKEWLFLNNEAMDILKKGADSIKESCNLFEVRYKDSMILIAPHTSEWWRIYEIKGRITFREEENPETIVFIKG